ncbi:MAG: hypothetical protein ACOH2H_06255 [Cypionkella sp.]
MPVDRTMDTAEVDHQGPAVDWHSAAGFRAPGPHDPESEVGFSWAQVHIVIYLGAVLLRS